MYAAAVPVAVAYALLWNPPPSGRRPCSSTCSSGIDYRAHAHHLLRNTKRGAGAARLTDDYDQRTSYVSLAMVFRLQPVGLFVGVFALEGSSCTPGAHQPGWPR